MIDLVKIKEGTPEQVEVSVLRRRITGLEIENANLRNEVQDLKKEFLKTNHKLDFLVEELMHLRAENTQLKATISKVEENITISKEELKLELNECKKWLGRDSTVSFGPKSANDTMPNLTDLNSPSPMKKYTPKVLTKFAVGSMFSKSQHHSPGAHDSDHTLDGSFFSKPRSPENHDQSEYSAHDEGILQKLSSSDEESKVEFSGKKGRHSLFLYGLKVNGYNEVDTPVLKSQTESPKFGPRVEIEPTANSGAKANVDPTKNNEYFKNGLFRPQRLFENFLVYGIDKSDIQKYMADKHQSKKLLEGYKVRFEGVNVYNFADEEKIPNRVQAHELDKFLAPSGFNIVKCTSKGGKHLEYFQKVICKGQKKYSKRTIMMMRPHCDDGLTGVWDEYIDSMNPQSKLFVFSITKGDYIMAENKKKDKNYFFYLDSIFCFITYYPLPHLFFGMLATILNILKKKRKNIYCSINNKDQDLGKVDFTHTRQMIIESIREKLTLVLETGIPGPKKVIKYNFNDINNQLDWISFQYPVPTFAWLELANFKVKKVFEHFGLDDIIFLLSAILLEKHVVIFSEDMSLLTSTINTLLALICPIKYCPNVVSILPHDSLHLLESPFPILIGIAKGESYFWKKELNNIKGRIFVFLKEKRFYYDGTEKDLGSLPQANFIKDDIIDIFSKIGDIGHNLQVCTSIETLRFKKDKRIDNVQDARTRRKGSVFGDLQIPKVGKSEDPNLFNDLFIKTRQSIIKNLVENMKPFEGTIPGKDREGDMRKIDSLTQNRSLRNFLYLFRETLMFSNYPDTISQANLKI